MLEQTSPNGGGNDSPDERSVTANTVSPDQKQQQQHRQKEKEDTCLADGKQQLKAEYDCLSQLPPDDTKQQKLTRTNLSVKDYLPAWYLELQQSDTSKNTGNVISSWRTVLKDTRESTPCREEPGRRL